MEAKKTLCRVCSFGCLASAQVEDGVIRQLAPDRDTAVSRQFLCAKGYAGRQYVYSPERILTPLRRVGERGEGRFEPISWEEALDLVADKLNETKARFGPDAVCFYTGYTKWYRWLLHRLAHSFGTLNYGTESSSCFQATVVAAKCSAGVGNMPDLPNTGCVLAWAYDPDYSNLPLPKLEIAKAHGAKVIIIDPRLTTAAQRLADIHLRPRPGTDGALALGLGRFLIHAGLTDQAFIEESVLGYEAYAAYVEDFTPEKVSALTGVPEAEFRAACALMAEHLPISVNEGNAGMIHHINGVQMFRAVNALIAITGGFNRPGGNRVTALADPVAASPLATEAFLEETRPKTARPKLGSDTYPVWSACIDECQAMELPRAILNADPYPVRAVFGVGFNARLFPHNQDMFRALSALDFFADVDLFMNDTAKYADIVLPACSSMERPELFNVGRTLLWREPAIQPLGLSRSDADIFCQLAARLKLDDPVLPQGYEACCRYVMRDLPVTLEQVKQAGELTVPASPAEPWRFWTPSGKYELRASLLERYGYPGLPVYSEPLDSENPDLPFTMCSGGRLPGAFATRFNRVPWTRQALRPQAAVDINPDDAKALGLRQDDAVEVYTAQGSVTCTANVTLLVLPGMLSLYHGYAEADVNTLLPPGHNDPISGFPGYNSFRCGIRKKG